MLALKAHDTIALVPNIALHGDVDNNFFLAFNVITGEHFRLNCTSYWVLKSITEAIQWANLKKSFFQKFEVDRTQGNEDLDSLASQLLELNLVEINGGEKQ